MIPLRGNSDLLSVKLHNFWSSRSHYSPGDTGTVLPRASSRQLSHAYGICCWSCWASPPQWLLLALCFQLGSALDFRPRVQACRCPCWLLVYCWICWVYCWFCRCCRQFWRWLEPEHCCRITPPLRSAIVVGFVVGLFLDTHNSDLHALPINVLLFLGYAVGDNQLLCQFYQLNCPNTSHFKPLCHCRMFHLMPFFRLISSNRHG